MMTHSNTSLESCSDKTTPEDTTGQPSESKSGNRDAIAFQSLIDGLSNLEREGVSQVLHVLEQLTGDAERAQQDANFQRRKEICGGMVKAFNVAHRAIFAEFQLEEGI